jgi:hypothetical protein
MKIGLHTNQLSVRGTEVAMFDYAKYNEELLGNKSIILTKHPDVWKYSDPLAIQKFKDRFDVFFYKNNDELQGIIKEQKLDLFYAQKAGIIDDVVSKSCKTVVHAVFQYEQPHGDVYAYISQWLSKVYGYRHPYVPYMVELPDVKDDLREELGIPKNAFVYGRHGGFETFDIPFVKQAISIFAGRRRDIYFLFLNTDKFVELPNVIYLDQTADMVRKTKFINTCNAMIHARMAGESFGLAIAEFSIKNKPVLTCLYARDTAHLSMLAENAVTYHDQDSLYKVLSNTDRYVSSSDWNMYREFTPEAVMEKFKKVFIDK